MKYEINGRVIETEQPLSNDEIDEIGQQFMHESNRSSPDWYKPAEAAVQSVLPSQQSVEGIKPETVPTDLGSAVQSGVEGAFQALKDPTRMVGNTNELSSALGDTVKNATGSKLAGFATDLATNPLTYVGGGLGEAAKAGEAIAKPGFLQKLGNLFKKSADPSEVSGAVDEVKGMIKTATDKFGGLLNDAKSGVGLPTTVAEREAAIAKTGNAFGLDENDMTLMKSMKLDKVKSPEDLVSTIKSFKEVAQDIPEKSRARLASYLQDQINNFVDWDKQGNAVEGVLKNQYNHLNDVVESSSEALRTAKAKMANVLDNVNAVASKMEDPGQAEAFLRRIYRNPTGKNADYLAALRNLESLSGKETVDDLFKMFGSSEQLNLYHPIAAASKAALENAGDVIKATPKLAARVAGPAAAAFNPAFRTRELQSLRDKLRNQRK